MWLFRSGIVLLGYVVINIYTGIRFLKLIKYFFPSFRAFIFWPFYIFLCYSFVLVMLLRLDRIRPIRQAAMYSLPAFVYFFLALLVLDGARLLLQRFGIIPRLPGFSAAGAGIALGLVLIVMIYGSFHARDIYTVHYGVTLNKNMGEAPLRITLVSDLHIGMTVGRDWVANIVNAVNKTNPDMICIAGDIFDNDLSVVKDLEGVATELRRLKAPLGVYACPGNHDVDRFSLREATATNGIQDFLKKVDITFLQDQVELVADRFYLVGRRDASNRGAAPGGVRGERKSAAELVADLDRTKPVIFLDHQPVDFLREDAAGVDLVFSGHTHRGQFFPGNIATAYIYKKAGAVHYGYWKGRSVQGIVSSGAGVWGPAIRVATNSEVAVVDISYGA